MVETYMTRERQSQREKVRTQPKTYFQSLLSPDQILLHQTFFLSWWKLCGGGKQVYLHDYKCGLAAAMSYQHSSVEHPSTFGKIWGDKGSQNLKSSKVFAPPFLDEPGTGDISCQTFSVWTRAILSSRFLLQFTTTFSAAHSQPHTIPGSKKSIRKDNTNTTSSANLP